MFITHLAALRDTSPPLICHATEHAPEFFRTRPRSDYAAAGVGARSKLQRRNPEVFSSECPPPGGLVHDSKWQWGQGRASATLREALSVFGVLSHPLSSIFLLTAPPPFLLTRGKHGF
jgi:hypothetical protein